MICCESGDIWWPIIAVFIAPRLRHRHGTAWCLFTFCPRVNPRALFKLGFCFFFSRRGGEHPRIDKRIHLESGVPRQDIYIDTLQILAFSFCNRYLTLSSKTHETAFRNSWLSMEKKTKQLFPVCGKLTTVVQPFSRTLLLCSLLMTDSLSQETLAGLRALRSPIENPKSTGSPTCELFQQGLNIPARWRGPGVWRPRLVT